MLRALLDTLDTFNEDTCCAQQANDQGDARTVDVAYIAEVEQDNIRASAFSIGIGII
jgi:hypothetical protein